MIGTVRELFRDGYRFIHRNLEIVRHYPIHIFSSAVYTKRHCTVQNVEFFASSHTRKIRVVHGTERGWNPLITVSKGHSDCVNAIAFSGDGSRLASASDDTEVRLWNSKTGAHIATLEGHFDWVTSVAFSADGSRIASA